MFVNQLNLKKVKKRKEAWKKKEKKGILGFFLINDKGTEKKFTWKEKEKKTEFRGTNFYHFNSKKLRARKKENGNK